MMFERGVLDEEITVYGQSDHVCFEAVGNWGDPLDLAGFRMVPTRVQADTFSLMFDRICIH